jgi:hypothetical protein
MSEQSKINKRILRVLGLGAVAALTAVGVKTASKGKGSAPVEYVRNSPAAQPAFVSRGIASVDDFPMGSDATVDEIKEWVAGKNFKSKGEFIGALPEELRGNFIIMTESESSQPATPDKPRVLLQSNDARIIVGFNTERDKDGKYVDTGVELIVYNQKTKRPDFALIDFDGTGKHDMEKNPETCKACHGESLRWNWDAYDSWANQLPFNKDKLYKGSSEEKMFKRLFVSLAQDDAFKHLKLPPGATLVKDASGKVTDLDIKYAGYGGSYSSTVTGPDGKEHKTGGDYLLMYHPRKGNGSEGQGVALFDHLTPLNASRVGEMVKTHDNFKRFKFALAGAMRGCFSSQAEVEKFYPPEFVAHARDMFQKTLEELKDDTMKRRKSLPASKFELQKKNLRAIIKSNAKAEGKTLTESEIETLMWDDLYRRNEGVDYGGGVITDRETYYNNDTITALRYALEPEGVPVDEWSMSNADRMRTYTFADLFDQYSSQINDAVSDPEVKAAGYECSKLAEASQKAYKGYKAPAKNRETRGTEPASGGASSATHTTK